MIDNTKWYVNDMQMNAYKLPLQLSSFSLFIASGGGGYFRNYNDLISNYNYLWFQ